MKKRLFLILWTAGIAGVLSLLFIDLSALIASLPLPEDAGEMPSPLVLKIVSVIQPAILTTIAVLVGLALARKVGLHAPAAEAWARGESYFQALKPQILPGIAAGIAGGCAIVLFWVVVKPFLSTEFISRAEHFNTLLPHVVRFMYGGITEEILLRWGLMTFLVWIGWKLFQRGRGEPHAGFVLASIFLSALLFGVGHLPIAFLINNGLDLPVVVYVIMANGIFGIVAGFLYWRRGLESAIISHMFAHVVLIAAIALRF
jgi:membrane protease YdiL (CAAX protease family)